MKRRHARLLGTVVTAVAVLVVPFVLTQLAVAQTTTTGAPLTTVPTTTLPTTTSPVATTAAAPTSTSPAASTTTAPPATAVNTDSSDDTPWAFIAVAVVLALAIIGGLVAWSRHRGQSQQAIVDWRRRAASTASEASATARLLAGGTPVAAGIAQQLRGSVRTFEDLLASAPDDAARQSAQRAIVALREVGIAIDADSSARSAQPPFPPAQIAAAAAGLRNTASEADGTLRAVYNEVADAG